MDMVLLKSVVLWDIRLLQQPLALPTSLSLSILLSGSSKYRPNWLFCRPLSCRNSRRLKKIAAQPPKEIVASHSPGRKKMVAMLPYKIRLAVACGAVYNILWKQNFQ